MRTLIRDLVQLFFSAFLVGFSLALWGAGIDCTHLELRRKLLPTQALLYCHTIYTGLSALLLLPHDTFSFTFYSY